MLRTMKDVQGYAVPATDGNIGHVKDVYFDDQQRVVRYLIAGIVEVQALLARPVDLTVELAQEHGVSLESRFDVLRG
jgi:hypothetical protein